MMSEHDRTTQLDATIALLVETRRQRDEALQALRTFVDAHRHNIDSNLTYTPYVEACRILAQYETEDAE